MTNGDRIRAMTDEELAVLLGDMGNDFPPYCTYSCDENCIACCVKWLKQEVEDGY